MNQAGIKNLKVKVNLLKAPFYHEAEDFILDKEYLVLAIEGDDYRLLSDIDGPYRYPKNLFEITDPTIPEDWINGFAPKLFKVGFFEDYFDNKPSAINAFNQYLERLGIQPERIVLANGKIKYPYRVVPPLPGTQTKKVKMKSDLPHGLIEPGYFIPNTEYIVLGMEDDSYYLLPENGDPALFKQKFFELTEPLSTQEWVVICPSYRNITGEMVRTERVCPRGLNTLSFWKKYIDNDIDTVKAFNLYYGPLGVPLYRIVQADGTVVKLETPVFQTT